MDIREGYDRATLSATQFAMEFGEEPQLWTVEKVYKKQFKDKEETLCKFAEHPWAITLNTKRRDTLWHYFGTNETEEWGGGKVRLTHGPSTNDKGPCRTIVVEPLEKPKKRNSKSKTADPEGG